MRKHGKMTLKFNRHMPFPILPISKGRGMEIEKT